ncbi:hypothetical protein B296_00057689 [Ensete ventricosum]|uniref:Uncharacterized protein n=1 Tax=Ensete ventricosum TaxID=4639 RepID=A0A426XQ80_ENSVE|nr:hypothetical protein B296_00057689 [Ensete ventricosum]
MIELTKEYKEEDFEPEEENTKEGPQPTDCMTHTLTDHANPQAIKVEESLKQQAVTILIKTRSTNNFMNSKVATQLMLQNEDCSRFDIEITDGRILKYSQLKLFLQGQRIIANFFLLPLDDYEVVLNTKCLTTLGDVP